MEGPHKKVHHCHGNLSGAAIVGQCLLGHEADIAIFQKFHSQENTPRELCTGPQGDYCATICGRKKLDLTCVSLVRGMDDVVYVKVCVSQKQ